MDVYETSLWKLLKKEKDDGYTNFTMNSRLEVLTKVIDGIIFLQGNGLAHLDIKPGNIMLKNNNTEVVVTDFGLCSDYSALSGHAGTPGYGAPEQFNGQPTPTSDNYAVGKLSILVFEII